MHELELHIIRTLNYFAYFGHPLTGPEIHKYLGVKVDMETVSKVLSGLVAAGKVHRRGSWFALEAAHFDQRMSHLELNEKLLRIGHRMAGIMARFPFVEAVFISGSLSKLGAQKGDDIDYFIITSAGKLWTVRFMLMAFKKVFLLNSKKYFCVNLLKSLDGMEVKRRNIYIATEAASLIPVYNTHMLAHFFQANAWIARYFPNIPFTQEVVNCPRRLSLMERLLKGRMGERLERWARKRYNAHLQNLRAQAANAHYEYASHTSAHFPDSPEQAVVAHYQKSSFHSAV